MIPRPPIVGVCRDPLLGFRPDDMYEVAVGASLAELAPDPQGRPLICSLVGVDGYLLRKDWVYRVRPGDIVLFEVDPPQDRDAMRGLLQIVAIVVAIWNPAGYGAVMALAINVAAAVLLPVVGPAMANEQSASPTYSTSLSGNIARLDQPIPKVCGRHKLTPPFAAQPYLEYDSNGDQFYFAVFAVGIGTHTIERALIDDTDITHFADVLTNQYLPAGTLPSVAKVNVVTAPEVAGQDMVTGRYIGGFAACAPRKKAASIGIDVLAPRGLGVADEETGDMGITTLQWRVEIREIDDFGDAVSPWTLLATESKTAATTEVQRWSFKYDLPTPIRPEIRLMRTNARNNSVRALNDGQWGGLRAYLDEEATLNPNTAHYEVVLRASEQLSGMSQRNISLIVRAHTRKWHPIMGWSAEAHTRNPAWWLADLWSSSIWGEGLPDSRIDLQTLYELSLIWEERQDRFDYVFDVSMDAWEAAQLIAGAGRARCFRRYGVHTLARDQLAELPVTAFTPRTCVPNSMSMGEALPTRDTPDGVVIEYFDNRLWDWLPIECPCPGVESMSNPVRKRKPGITGAMHAEREGLYEAASLLYRRRRTKCTTEMQGMLPAYMSPIRWQPEIVGYGQSGDVAFWDPDTLVMGLSEPAAWGPNQLYLTLVRDDGSLTTPVPVTPGPTEYDVTLPAEPDFLLVLDDGTRERPKFILGPLDTCDELVKISAISDGGKSDDGVQLYSIEAVVDDERVHEADNALLPGPGDLQDPVDSDPLGDNFFVNIGNSDGLYEPASQVIIGHVFRNDGVEQVLLLHPVSGTSLVSLPVQWLIGSPVEVEAASIYEIYVTATQPLKAGSSPLNTWLSLGTTRQFLGEGFTYTDLTVQIREIASGIVQDTAGIRIYGDDIYDAEGEL